RWRLIPSQLEELLNQMEIDSEELSGLIPGAVRFTFPSLALSLHQTITFSNSHIRLRHYLSKISHRFRIFLLLQFLVVTVSQFTTFFQTTAYSGRITSLRWSKLLGLFCLHAATKISHRAQAIASVARLVLVEFTWKPPRIHPSPFRI
ncbi:hypothetical protein HID58_047282, partial [Brassica napus]